MRINYGFTTSNQSLLWIEFILVNIIINSLLVLVPKPTIKKGL